MLPVLATVSEGPKKATPGEAQLLRINKEDKIINFLNIKDLKQLSDSLLIRTLKIY